MIIALLIITLLIIIILVIIILIIIIRTTSRLESHDAPALSQVLHYHDQQTF